MRFSGGSEPSKAQKKRAANCGCSWLFADAVSDHCTCWETARAARDNQMQSEDRDVEAPGVIATLHIGNLAAGVPAKQTLAFSIDILAFNVGGWHF